ncbi:hypothetical protein RYH73_11055 [Olivibacter sp. CPCC 100613]|uniref:hypothetical protein n=1 Tax=Olivibacter sp. CPCC 100613 TaxID=3079931 RepID=UPI002FF6D3B9
MNRKHTFGLLLGLVAVLAINLLFVLVVLSPAKYSIFDFTSGETSNIATTITGLTTPILTLFSAYLLYLALTKQTESNETQKLKNDVDMVAFLFNQLDTEFNGISLRQTITSRTGTNQPEKRIEDSYGLTAMQKICASYHNEPKYYKTMYAMDQVKSTIASFLIVEEAISCLGNSQF